MMYKTLEYYNVCVEQPWKGPPNGSSNGKLGVPFLGPHVKGPHDMVMQTMSFDAAYQALQKLPLYFSPSEASFTCKSQKTVFLP